MKDIFHLVENEEFPDSDFFFNNMRNKTYLEPTDKNVALTDDWIQIWKPKSKRQQGGLWMWSNKMQKLRSVSQSEYYGKGIVD
jgi:hypothetical protein